MCSGGGAALVRAPDAPPASTLYAASFFEPAPGRRWTPASRRRPINTPPIKGRGSLRAAFSSEGSMMMVDSAQVNFPSYRRTSAEPAFPPADRCLPTTRECQQSNTSGLLEDWRPGHRDRPLSFRWKADYETLSRSLGLPACKSKRGERAMASIVYDAALSAREDPERRISYSRRKDFYAMAGRYDGTDYGYDTVVPAVDVLVAVGLLVDHDKVKGSPRGTGIQSSFRPMPGLAHLVLPRPDYRVGETIRLPVSNRRWNSSQTARASSSVSHATT